ncbi:MAG TPA: carboxypeptidase-like regulatory domain-containing protein, partial [Hanamia sp.]
MRILTLSLFALLISSVSVAQQMRTVHGSVTDTTGSPLYGVTVNLHSPSENLTTVTTSSGSFHFAKVSSIQFVITITSVGFVSYSQAYTITGKEGRSYTIKPVKLKVKVGELSEVVIEKTPITIKEDTIEYRADAYKVRDGAPVEDIIKKLPGVTVDKDGNITAQGKLVQRVRVNGKDYFGGDVQTATQNLPANIIENIQIIDDYGDKANLTGIKEGDPEKVLNINIQKGKNRGNFGNGTVAGGTDERYMGRVSANSFNNDRQISFLGSINNTNANTFNFNGGGRGGGARGANFGSVERGGAGGNGNTITKSLGFNFRDTWSKKITTYGSYSFSSRNNTTIGTSFQQDLNPLNIRTTGSKSDNSSKTGNHRVTWNMEYKIDSADYLKITPYFSYASSDGNSNAVSNISADRNDTTYYTLNKSASLSHASSPAAGSGLLYNHRFKKPGRNLTITSTVNYSMRSFGNDARNEYHDSTNVYP